MDTVTTAAAAAAVTTDARAQRRRRRAAWLAGMKAPTLAGSVPASDGIRRPGDCVRARDRHRVPYRLGAPLARHGAGTPCGCCDQSGPRQRRQVGRPTGSDGIKAAVPRTGRHQGGRPPSDRMASHRPPTGPDGVT
ncbi:MULTISPECIES: hypothetical protein [Streptomyces violaceusniger group]|uniref:hypothetical protein n=1 Tax=Streptomyces violaceusniger group TaxID=2839105 RepID=UPI00355604A6